MWKYLMFSLGLLAFFACNPKDGEKNGNESDADTLSSPKDKIGVLSEKINEDNDDPDLYNERAVLYMEQGMLNEAFADIRNTLLIDSLQAKYYETFADIQFALGKPSKTKAALHKAIKLDPEYTAAYLKLAELHFYYQEYKQTFEYTSKALKINDKLPKAYFIRGMAFSEKGYRDKAISSFQEVINLDPEHYKAFIELGFIYAKKGDPLAESYFKGALNIDPQSIEALYALGMFYQKYGNPEEAINTYNMLLDVDSNNKFANYNIGYIHLAINEEFAKAIPFFNKAIAIDPEYIQAYYNKAHSYELLGQYKKAEAIFQEALKINPEYQMAIDGLNRVQDKLYR